MVGSHEITQEDLEWLKRVVLHPKVKVIDALHEDVILGDEGDQETHTFNNSAPATSFEPFLLAQ